MSTRNFYYSAGKGAVKAIQDVEGGVIDAKHVADFQTTNNGLSTADYFMQEAERSAQQTGQNPAGTTNPDEERDRRYFVIENMLQEGYIPSKEQFEILEYGRQKYGQSKGELIWNGIKGWAGAVGDAVVSGVETGDIINPLMLTSSLAEGTIRGTTELGIGVSNMANDSTHPFNGLFAGKTLDERYEGFVNMMKVNNWYEHKKKEGFVFDSRYKLPVLGEVRGFNEDIANASSYVLDAGTFIPGFGNLMAMPVKAPMQLAAHGLSRFGMGSGNLAVKAANIGRAGLVIPKKAAGFVEKVADGIIDTTTDTIGKAVGVKMAHVGNGVITPMDLKLRAATRGGVLASALVVPYGGQVASAWVGAKVTSTLINTADEALELAAKDAAEGVPSNLTIAERLRYQSADSGVRLAGIALDKATPIAQYLKTVAQNSFQGSLYGGAYGFIFGGEDGFYTGLGTGLAMGGTYGTLGATYNAMPTRSKGNNEILKHFHYMMESEDMPNKRGISRLLEYVHKENGEDAAYQVMGMIVANKRLQKASKQLILTEEDIQLLAQDDNYAKWRDQLLNPAFGGITFVKEPDGTTVQIVNADRAGASAVSGEMFHTALMNGRYGLMFREEIRDAFLGNEDEGGTLWELPPDERVAVLRKFAEAYLGDNDPAMKGSQEALRADFEKTIAMVERGEKPATLTKLFEEMTESYWNRFAEDRGAVGLINDNSFIGNVFRGAFHTVKDMMATDIKAIGGDIQFSGKNGVDGFFLDANGKRIRIPALDKVMRKLVKEMKKDGDFGFPKLERPVSADPVLQSREFKRDANGALVKDKNGNAVPLTDEEYQQKMDEDVDGLFSDLSELDAKDRGIIFKPKKPRGGTSADASFSPSKKMTKAQREAARRIKAAEKEVERERKAAEREAKKTESQNIDMPWLDVAKIVREGVEEGEKFEFEISGKFTAKEREIFQRRFGIDTTRKLETLLHSVNSKGIDLNNAVMVRYKTKGSQRRNFTAEGKDTGRGNEKGAATEKVRKFVPYKVYIGFERGKRTQYTDKKNRVRRKFAIKNSRIYAEAIDMDARMNRTIHAFKHARVDREGFSAKTTQALFGSIGELEHAVNRLMSNYSRGEVALAGADFFGGGRDGAMKRDIVNAIIGAHPTVDMIRSGIGFENYPKPMQLRGGMNKELSDFDIDTEAGPLNEAYTTWTTLRVDRMTTVPKSLHGEGFYYDHDKSYDLAQANYQPQRRGHDRDHEGNMMLESEKAWTVGSVVTTPTGEPYRVYFESYNKFNENPNVMYGEVGPIWQPEFFTYLRASESEFAVVEGTGVTALEEAARLIENGKKVVKVVGQSTFFFHPDAALPAKSIDDDALVRDLPPMWESWNAPSFSPQKRRPNQSPKDLADFSYKAIQKIAKIEGPTADTPLAVLAEMSRGELEQWLVSGRLGIKSKARAALGSELAMRHMQVWDQMISKMHAINYHADLGIDHSKLDLAGNKIFERVLRNKFEEFKKQEVKAGKPEPVFEEFLNREYEFREQLRAASRDQILRFIASYEVGDTFDGMKIPKESWRRVHDAVMEASGIVDMDVVDKVNTTIALLLRDLRANGEGTLARKLNKALNRSMEDASARLKQNAEKLIKDGTVSINWRETISDADRSRIIRTDLTGHFIKETTIDEIDNEKDSKVLVKNLRKLGAIVTTVKVPKQSDARRFASGEITKGQLRSLAKEVNIVYIKGQDGNLIQQFAFRDADITGEVAVQGTKESIKITGFDENLNPVGDTTRKKTSKVVKGQKKGYEIWVPYKDTGKVTLDFAEGDMLMSIDALSDASMLTAENFNDMAALNIPMLKQMTKMVRKTSVRYEVYRPHGYWVDWRGEIPYGTPVEELTIGSKNIQSKAKMFKSLDEAKAAVVDDIVGNYSDKIHLKSHVTEVDGMTKDGLLNMISSSTMFKFKNPNLFRVYNVGDFILVTGRNEQGKMRSLRNMKPEDVFGAMQRKPLRIQKKGGKALKEGEMSDGAYTQSFTNYAEIFRYVKERDGLPASIERVVSDKGDAFRSEADVRKFINEASRASSGLLSKMQLTSKISERWKLIKEQWNQLHRDKIINVLINNPKQIRSIEAKMREHIKPLIEITQRVRNTYETELKGQTMLASEQIARLFSLKNEKGELLTEGVTMADQFGQRVRPPSETIYRKSRAYKTERGVHKSKRIQARNEDGTLKFDDNNQPVYEMTEETLQNDSVDELRVYMEPILQNQIYEIFKQIGFLEITGAPWKRSAPQWVVDMFDKVRNERDYTPPFEFTSVDIKSFLMDAYEDGRDVFYSYKGGLYGPLVDRGVKSLSITAEAFRQLQKQYDDMGTLLEKTNENEAYVKLEKRRDALAEQLDRALNRKKKGGNGNAKVRDMTELELEEFMRHAEKVKAEYEAGRTKVETETDILRDEIIEVEGEATKTYQEYVPIDGEDKNWVSRTDMKKLQGMIEGDILSMPSHIVRMLGTRDVVELFKDREFLKFLKGDVKAGKKFGPADTSGVFGHLQNGQFGPLMTPFSAPNTEFSTRMSEIKSMKQAMDAMSNTELERLSEINQYLESIKRNIYDSMVRLEKEIRNKEYETIRLTDPAQKFIELVPKLTGDPNTKKYYSAIANEFDAVIRAASVDNIAATQRGVDALMAKFKSSATARHVMPIEAEARKILEQIIIDSVGLTFRRSTAFKELFGDEPNKKTTFVFANGASIKGLIDTHGIFSDQVRQWIDRNTFTEKPTRRFKHNRVLHEGETESRDSTNGIYLDKKALEALAQIDKLRDVRDAELASIENASIAFNTSLNSAMVDYSKKRLMIDREINELYEKQEAELARYWDEDSKTGELWQLTESVFKTQTENVAYAVSERLREFFTKINAEILNRRIETERRREGYLEHFRRIKQLASSVPPEISKNFDMYAMYGGEQALQLRKEFPNTWSEFYIEAAIPENSVLNKYQGRKGRSGGESVGIRDVSHQIMKQEALFHEFRKVFGIGEVELFDKARGLLEYYTKYEGREIEPERLRLIGRYFPEEAQRLAPRVEAHIDSAPEIANVEEAIHNHDLHKSVLAEALVQVSSDQSRIKDVLKLIHGEGAGAKRFEELQALAQGKRRSQLIDASDLAIEELEAVTFQLGNIVPYISDTGANIEGLSAQELIEGPMFKEWTERNLMRKASINSSESQVINTIFDTPQMQALWAATPFLEKMQNLTKTVSGVRKKALEMAKKERDAAYVDAVAERVRQKTEESKFFDPAVESARKDRLEKQRLEQENAERLTMLKELFRKLNVVDTSMKAFKGRAESFFKNRAEARDAILGTEDWSTLHEIPRVKLPEDASKAEQFFETPNKRYLAMRKPNGSVSLIFNGYTEAGGMAIKPHQLGVYPDMDRAQVAIRFADDDLHRLRAITEYTNKHGIKPPERVTMIGEWASTFLDKNSDLLSDAERMALKDRLGKIGVYPESAMIELRGTGSVRKFMIYPNSKLWDLLHSNGDYEKGSDGVWRRNGLRELEAETEAKIREIRSQTNKPVDDSKPAPKFDQSRNDPVSDAVDQLSSFEVKEEAPVYPSHSLDPVSVDWIRLRNRLGYELRRIQEHRKGKWITYYRMFNPAAGMIAESANEEDAVAEMYKDFINGNK